MHASFVNILVFMCIIFSIEVIFSMLVYFINKSLQDLLSLRKELSREKQARKRLETNVKSISETRESLTNTHPQQWHVAMATSPMTTSHYIISCSQPVTAQLFGVISSRGQNLECRSIGSLPPLLTLVGFFSSKCCQHNLETVTAAVMMVPDIVDFQSVHFGLTQWGRGPHCIIREFLLHSKGDY